MSKKVENAKQAEEVVDTKPADAAVDPAPPKPEEAKVLRTPAQILDDLVSANLAELGAAPPWKIVREEYGEFIAINNRPGLRALIVQCSNGVEFKLGPAQAKRLGIKVPTPTQLKLMSATK